VGEGRSGSLTSLGTAGMKRAKPKSHSLSVLTPLPSLRIASGSMSRFSGLMSR